MNDVLAGAHSEVEALEIYRGLMHVLAGTGIQLRKWLCKDTFLLKQLKINEE